MRKTLPEKLEAGRMVTGPFASSKAYGPNGIFQIYGPCALELRIIASAGDVLPEKSQGWEHVSVSTKRRCPNWVEMCFVKDLFWEPEECVVQFHPPASEYVNNHAYCLHLFRPTLFQMPMPPALLVGSKHFGQLKSPAEKAAAVKYFIEANKE